MMGLASARARCERQRLHVQQARSRVHWWQAQTSAAAARAATSAPALMAAAVAGWWVGRRRRVTGQARIDAKARITWQSARHLFVQALRAWTFWRGLQMNLGIAPSRRAVAARQDWRPSATPHSGPTGRP